MKKNIPKKRGRPAKVKEPAKPWNVDPIEPEEVNLEDEPVPQVVPPVGKTCQHPGCGEPVAPDQPYVCSVHMRRN